MTDHTLAGRNAGFLELRLLANGILESRELALWQGDQERLEHNYSLSHARIQVIVVRLHLSPHFIGILGRSFREVIISSAEILPNILHHLLPHPYTTNGRD